MSINKQLQITLTSFNEDSILSSWLINNPEISFWLCFIFYVQFVDLHIISQNVVKISSASDLFTIYILISRIIAFVIVKHKTQSFNRHIYIKYFFDHVTKSFAYYLSFRPIQYSETFSVFIGKLLPVWS